MEILPCPFCGGKAAVNPLSKELITCLNCPSGGIGWVRKSIWNQRRLHFAANDAFSQFKSSLDQEYTARTKAEALVKTLEGAIEEILLFLSKSKALPPKILSQMMDDYENYKKSKEV